MENSSKKIKASFNNRNIMTPMPKTLSLKMYNINLSSSEIKNFIPIEYPKFCSKMKFKSELRQQATFVPNKNNPIHSWFHYTQGFSQSLVEFCLNSCKNPKYVFDPFSGVGTTSLTCMQHGIKSVGIDISPLPVFISNVKLNFPYDLNSLKNDFKNIKIKKKKIKNNLINKSLFEKAFSERNLEDILLLKESINNLENMKNRNLFLLALISIMEKTSNIRKHGAHYRFINNDNVGVKSTFNAENVRVEFTKKINSIIKDIFSYQNHESFSKNKNNLTYVADARTSSKFKNFDTVITSPPYLNRDNYIAQSKLELFLLDLVNSFDDYKMLTKSTLRSHVEANLESTSNFYPDYLSILYKKVKKNPSYPAIPDMIVRYFQDIHQVLNQIKKNMKNNTKLFFVLGNVRYSGTVIPVDTIFSHIAESLEYNVEEIIISRFKSNSPQQMSKFGKIPLRESIVILKGLK